MSAATSGARASLFTRLYTGTGAFDIVGRRKIWYTFFGVLVVVSIASMVLRGFNLGVDFTGGTSIQFPAGAATVQQVEATYAQALGQQPSTVQTVGSGGSASIVIRSPALSQAQVVALKQALVARFHPVGSAGQSAQDAISDSAVSASWGGEITRQAAIALGVFLVLVTVFLAFYFERPMALAALIALGHDVVVTAGIYSLVGFEVTPGTVIGLLTILGFSLYDTVVVFDKVRENARGLLGLTRRTYAETANLALNQTLMRSINTSLIAVLPVLGLLVVGVGVLGVGTLKDLALVQLVGLLAGTASSIFLATPLLVDVKMRDRRFQAQARRVAARRTRLAQQVTGPTGEEVADPDAPIPDEDAALAAELRRERALTAAASVPARTGKGAHSARRSPTRRPTGKSGRPTGKRHR